MSRAPCVSQTSRTSNCSPKWLQETSRSALRPRGAIGPEHGDPLATRAHERERLARRTLRGIALEIQVEDVVPRRGAARTRLDLRELYPRGRERLQRANERARHVLRHVHEARLHGTRQRRERSRDLVVVAPRDGEEPRVVV